MEGLTGVVNDMTYVRLHPSCLTQPLCMSKRGTDELRLDIRLTPNFGGGHFAINCLDRITDASPAQSILRHLKRQGCLGLLLNMLPQCLVLVITRNISIIPQRGVNLPCLRPRKRLRHRPNTSGDRLAHGVKLTPNHCMVWENILLNMNCLQELLKFW